MIDSEEYYGGTYPSPLEDEEMEEDFDYGDYIDYCYENYRDNKIMNDLEGKDNE